MTLERKIAKNLLEIEAVALRPNDYFTWTSGIKSPIYCDNRITMSYPKIRREIAAGLSEVEFSRSRSSSGNCNSRYSSCCMGK